MDNNAEKKQAQIAAQCLLKVQDIFEKCGLPDVIITFEGNDYQVIEELKKAIRMLHHGKSI